MQDATTLDDLAAASSNPNGYLKHFWCPSQMNEPDTAAGPYLYYAVMSDAPEPWLAWNESQSYIFNEAAMGWDDDKNRARGQLARIRKQSQTMVMSDGLGGATNRGTYPFSTLYNKVSFGPVTMGDALAGNDNGGDPQNFDSIRHRGKINIGFFDGHVEMRNISAEDLSDIYLMAP